MEARTRSTAALVIAMILLLIVVGAGAYLIGHRSNSRTNASNARGTTVVVNNGPGAKVSGRNPIGRRVLSTPSGAHAAGVESWPRGLAAYTVILQSASTRDAAGETARSALALGPAGVLYSSDYASLRPGYWVAYGGRYPNQAAAGAAASRYRANGFGDAYPRLVAASSSATPAPSSAQPVGDWPGGTSGYTVVLASVASSATAEGVANRARSAGLTSAGILRSDDHSSLRAGYWVAFDGTFDSREAAAAEQARARGAGFSDAYVRYVSAR